MRFCAFVAFSSSCCMVSALIDFCASCKIKRRSLDELICCCTFLNSLLSSTNSFEIFNCVLSAFSSSIRNCKISLCSSTSSVKTVLVLVMFFPLRSVSVNVSSLAVKSLMLGPVLAFSIVSAIPSAISVNAKAISLSISPSPD